MNNMLGHRGRAEFNAMALNLCNRWWMCWHGRCRLKGFIKILSGCSRASLTTPNLFPNRASPQKILAWLTKQVKLALMMCRRALRPKPTCVSAQQRIKNRSNLETNHFVPLTASSEGFSRSPKSKLVRIINFFLCLSYHCRDAAPSTHWF